MALLDGYTYNHNQWQTLFATGPASPSTAGVPLPDGSRLVVEFAKVTPDNWDDSPAVTWTDITAYVNQIVFATGDTTCALSRWSIEQATIITKDLTDVLGDFVDLSTFTPGVPPGSFIGASGPAPGSFVRWGIVTAAGAWTPRQSLLVDRISDRVAGRVRGWEIRAVGTLVYFSGLIFENSTPPGGANINTYMGTVCSTYTFLTDYPWPWAETFAAQDGSLPSTIDVSKWSAGRAKLLLLHQLADSQGMRLYNDANGGIYTALWNAFTATGFRVADETTIAKPGHDLVAGTILATAWQWVRGADRVAGTFRISPRVLSAASWGYTPWFPKWAKRWSTKLPNVTDGLAASDDTKDTALGNLLLSLLPSELRLDRVSIDTARDATAWALLTTGAGGYVWPGKSFTFERRRPKVEWLERTVYVHAVEGVIEFATGKGRATMDYTTRIAG